MNVKVLIAGIVLIIVLGVGGLAYRNVLEHPATPSGTACTLEAKICPDGTTVGRSGPSCQFSACPPPNVSLDNLSIGFALPAGYAATQPTGTPLPAASYFKTASSTTNVIGIYDYPIIGTTTPDDVIIANTQFEPSGMQATDMSRFTPKIIGTRTFSEVTFERFEGVVETAYFLPRKNDVLEFVITEPNVANWTDSNLIPDNLPEHKALIQMLGTLEDDESQQ